MLVSTLVTAVVVTVTLAAAVVAGHAQLGETEIVSHTTGSDGEIEIVSLTD
ncbi:MAG: hypothetical protein Q7T56_11615 [Nocardioidaceae bacterium]|nr:hypothetical protein [Nocardioidaceae bacterium]